MRRLDRRIGLAVACDRWSDVCEPEERKRTRRRGGQEVEKEEGYIKKSKVTCYAVL